jgi:hypothetical protein
VLVKRLGRCPPVKSLARPGVEGQRYCLESILAVSAQIGADIMRVAGDMDEAVTWVKRCPNPMPGPSEIEIRLLYEMADLR